MANISSSASNTILNGTGSADTITSIGRNVQIYAGSGNDSVHVYGAQGSNSISGDDGNDIILAEGAMGTTITGGNDDDSILGHN